MHFQCGLLPRFARSLSHNRTYELERVLRAFRIVPLEGKVRTLTVRRLVAGGPVFSQSSVVLIPKISSAERQKREFDQVIRSC